MGSTLYKSKVYLEDRFVKRRWTMDQIAEECGVSKMTVFRYLEYHKLLRNQRKK